MSKPADSSLEFRKDINGLRAWAVLAVLLFHFPLFGLAGGFAGVDVFFVISGYLMTAIIISRQEKNQFSLLHFYLARARRILPALLLADCGVARCRVFLAASARLQKFCFGGIL